MRSPNVHAPRLNPFVLPSDTDFRFVLLIFAILSASIFIYSSLYFFVPANADSSNAANRAYAAVEIAHPGNSDTAFNAKIEALERYIYPSDRRQALWVIGCVIVELSVAFVIFLSFPRWKIWRSRLEPLNKREEMRDMIEYLTSLCREMNLSHYPTFVWDPSDLAAKGLAFGRLGQYYIALSAGLVYQFSVDRAAFRAIVLHELSHLRNDDVDKTYFTVSIYWIFVIAALVPILLVLTYEFVLAASLSFTGSQYLLGINTIWRLVTLSVLVYLTRNAVLRAREIYADARASIVMGQDGALTRVLQSFPNSKRRTLPPLLRVHPTSAERSLMLTDLSQLFHVKFWDAFCTGAAVMIALPSVVDLLYSLHIGGGASFTSLISQEVSFLGTGLILALFLGGFFVQGIWRSALLRVTSGTSQRTIIQLGLGAALGVLLGQALSLHDVISSNYAKAFLFYFSFDVLWSLFFLISMVFFLQWISTCVSAWLEVANESPSPLLTYWIGVIAASVELAVILGVLYWIRYLTLGTLYALTLNSIVAFLSDLLNDVQVAILSPLILLAVIVLWAYPLATWFWRTRKARPIGSSWAFLDSSSQQLVLPTHAPLRLGLALRVGVVGGLAFWVLLVLLPFEVRLAIPRSIRLTDQFTFMAFYVTLALAMLAQGVIAIIVVKRVQWLNVQHGLFAAFITGFIAAMGLLGGNVLAGGGVNPLFSWIVVGTIINGGALVALLFAGVGTLGRKTPEVERPETIQPALPVVPPIPKSKLRLKIGLTVSAVLFALVLTSIGSTALLTLIGRTIPTTAVAPVTVVAAPTPYPPYQGNLIFVDPLSANPHHSWDEGNGCAFIAKAYHVAQNQLGLDRPCIEHGMYFRNFIFEVQITITTAADSGLGGIIFRANPVDNTYYDFIIARDGSYALNRFDGNSTGIPTRIAGACCSSAIKTSQGQSNTIAVVADGGMIALYVNYHKLTSVQDSTYQAGSIGFITVAINKPTEVVYSNVRVWVL